MTSRSGMGSTSFEKKFPGGYIALVNANAVMDLSSKTTKKGIQDEFSKWSDIPGFGDPDTLADLDGEDFQGTLHRAVGVLFRRPAFGLPLRSVKASHLVRSVEP